MKIFYSFLALSIVCLSATAQKKVDLKYQLELNKTYRVKNTSVQNTTQTVRGNQQAVQTTNTVVFSLKPLKQVDSTMIAEVRFDTMITLISAPQMEINSTREGDLKSSDPAKIMECIVNRMCNSTFLVKMSNTGKVQGFMNLEQTVSGILQGIDSIQGQMAGFIKARAKMMVEEGALKSMIESVTAYLPGKEVKIGDKWETGTIFSGGGMEMTISGTYKLVDLQKKVATISGDLVTESGSKPMEMNGAQIIPDIRGIGKTEMTIDAATGWIIKGTSKQQLKGELNVNAQGNSMQIPMEINVENEMIALP